VIFRRGILVSCGLVLLSCSRAAPEPEHALTLQLPAQSRAAGQRYRLVVDRTNPAFAQLPQIVELTREAAGSPAEPWAVVREEPADLPRDFAPEWRELQDGSLLLSWGGEDTSTTIVVAPQADGRWAGTATHHWYDGTSTAAPAELERP
jgi:hypothetical protein